MGLCTPVRSERMKEGGWDLVSYHLTMTPRLSRSAFVVRALGGAFERLCGQGAGTPRCLIGTRAEEPRITIPEMPGAGGDTPVHALVLARSEGTNSCTHFNLEERQHFGEEHR